VLVVKVGGSLYDLPDLAGRLRGFLAESGDPDYLLVPGGGAAAEVIRAYDRTHGIGEACSHWLALRACLLNAHLLRALLPGIVLVADPAGHRGDGILDPFAFAAADEGRPGCLPHCWGATSDSVAARVAVVAGCRLVLLKSVTIPAGMTWEEAARAGLVDPAFPGLVRQAGVSVRAVNLRA
jgi:aspartokinase-like uncharacterized kinase